MKKALFYFVILIGLVLGLLIQGPSTAWANSGQVTGWAWIGANNCDENGNNCDPSKTDPVGWISFNADNPNAPGNGYGVFADYDASAADTLQGAAWIGSGDSGKGVGWLSFKDNGVPTWESDKSNFAQVDAVSNEITGWAPIKSKDGSGNQSIITWVKFNGSGTNYKYSSKIKPKGRMGTSSTNHYAWAGGSNAKNSTKFGWIDLNPGLYASVDDDKELKFPPPNAKPEVSFDSSDFGSLSFNTLSQDYCEIDATGRVDLEWAYSDADGDDEAKYELKVYDSGGSLAADITETNLVSGEPKENGKTLIVTTDPISDLNFGESYTWEVKVYDVKGRESIWESASGYGFTIPAHPLPHPEFEVIPKTPEIETQVTFEDKSQCYDSATGDGHDCDKDSNVSYFWDFGDASTSNRIGTATHTYSTQGDYEVSLEVTDELGLCSTSMDISATLPLPEWEEVSSQ